MHVLNHLLSFLEIGENTGSTLKLENAIITILNSIQGRSHSDVLPATEGPPKVAQRGKATGQIFPQLLVDASTGPCRNMAEKLGAT